MNDTEAYVFGHLDAKDARIEELKTMFRACYDRAAVAEARIAELERLEPIAEVALRLDAAWTEPVAPGRDNFEDRMNELYGVCSVYRTKINECQAGVEQGDTSVSPQDGGSSI